MAAYGPELEPFGFLKDGAQSVNILYVGDMEGVAFSFRLKEGWGIYWMDN